MATRTLIWPWLAAVTVSMMGFAGCGGDDDDSATDTPRLLGVLQSADVGPVTVNQITPDYDEVFVAIMRETATTAIVFVGSLIALAVIWA